MSVASCDGCDRRVTVAGGIANVWSFDERRATGGTGLTLEFEDGTTYQLCFPCIDALPEEPSPADVEVLAERDLDHEDRPVAEDPQAEDAEGADG
ncbi:hypothetical protein [Halovivax sp.]|uniref:DUF7561 family protein n=1 Tax=Halovivax sp. TaxID=1935978 RepID=UPI0025C09114|nr:hypothetical protein [Halovivax sp.]